MQSLYLHKIRVLIDSLTNVLCFPDFFFCRSVKKGIQVAQILSMKTKFMLCNTFFCLFLLLFDDSGSAGQMHNS